MLLQGAQDSRFGFVGGGFDVERDDFVGQSREQACFDERRLAATGRAVDQADVEGLLRVAGLTSRWIKRSSWA